MTALQSAMLILVAAIWGSSFYFMRLSADVFNPVFFVFLRVGSAAVCLLGFVFVRQNWQIICQNWRALFIAGLCNSAFPFMLFVYSSQTLNAGVVAVLNATAPVFTAIIAGIWLKDKVSRMQILGFVISFIGTIYLVSDSVTVDWTSWLPVMAGIFACVFYGIYTNLLKKHLSHIPVYVIASGSMFFSALFMSVLSVFFIPDFEPVTAEDWFGAMMLGVVGTALAYLIFFRLIREIGPAKSVSSTFLVPIFAFLWAYLFLGEAVTWHMVHASVVVLFGTALVTGVIGLKK